jgi:hypothetical protein
MKNLLLLMVIFLSSGAFATERCGILAADSAFSFGTTPENSTTVVLGASTMAAHQFMKRAYINSAVCVEGILGADGLLRVKSIRYDQVGM